jgi:hypothetical protein
LVNSLTKELQVKLETPTITLLQVDLLESDAASLSFKTKVNENIYKLTLYHKTECRQKQVYISSKFNKWEELNKLLVLGWVTSYKEVLFGILDDELDLVSYYKDDLVYKYENLKEYLGTNLDHYHNLILVENPIINALLDISFYAINFADYKNRVLTLGKEYNINLYFEDGFFFLNDIKKSSDSSGVLEAFQEYLLRVSDKYLLGVKSPLIHEIVMMIEKLKAKYNLEIKNNTLAIYIEDTISQLEKHIEELGKTKEIVFILN